MHTGEVNITWISRLSAICLDRLRPLEGFRTRRGFAHGATVRLSAFDVAIDYDPRDPTFYVRLEGSTTAWDAFCRRVPGMHLRTYVFGTDVADRQDVVLRSREAVVLWSDFARLLGALNGWLLEQEIDEAAGTRESRDASYGELVRATGHFYRPWRLIPLLDEFRMDTGCGRLVVLANLGGEAPWLARLDSSEMPPSGEGTRWLPLEIGSQRHYLAAVLPFGGTTAWGAPIPSVRGLLASLNI